MNLLLEIGLKSLGLLTIAWLLWAAMRKASPALRHRVLALAFLGLAGLPLLAVRLPELRVETLSPTVRYSPPKSAFVAPNPASSATPMTPAPYSRQSPEPAEILPGLVVLVWGVGAFLLLARLLKHLFVANSLARGGTELALDPSLGLPPHIRLVRTSNVDIPVTLGYVRPTILLPEISSTWPEERLRAVLLHEGAHVRRADWLWLVLSGVMSALYWPNPLVHVLAAKMRSEAELAADDAVLRGGVSAPAYATTLVDLAEGVRSKPMVAALPFVDTGSLKARVVQILSATANRKPLGRGLAVAILCLGAAIVLPFAALRLVAGPARVLGGRLEVGNGHRLEIIAITEMNGLVAKSWDINGAVLPRPFPVGQTNRHELSSSNTGAIERYVILRTDDGEGEIPTLFATSGDALPTVAYVDQIDGTGQAFRDAIGGRYFVARIVAPRGAAKASFQTDLPTDDWKLIAYLNLKQGEVVGLLNPTLGMRVAQMIPARGKGVEATFTLPKKLADSEAMVRFLPDNRDLAYFQRFTGKATAYSSTPIERLQRVEILTRPMRKVEFGEIPLAPNPGATYTAHRFLPSGVIDSTGRLRDGTPIAIAGLAGNGSSWGPKGEPSTGFHYGEPAPPYLPNADGMPKRILTLWLETGPKRDLEVPLIYDGEGWPIFRGYSTIFRGEGTTQGFVSQVEESVAARDIVVPVAAGEKKMMVAFDRRTVGTKWSFSERQGWSGCLRVEYPIEKTAATQGMDVEIRPVSASGAHVKLKDANRISESAPGWIEFDLPAADADRVTAIEFRARPYTWVKFDDVALRPRSR